MFLRRSSPYLVVLMQQVGRHRWSFPVVLLHGAQQRGKDRDRGRVFHPLG
jgi:hypothetical protein